MKKANDINPHFGTSRIYDIALWAYHDAISYDINEDLDVIRFKHRPMWVHF